MRRILVLIAKEAGSEMSDLNDHAAFVNSGVESLVSSAIIEQVHHKFGIAAGGSLIIQYPIV